VRSLPVCVALLALSACALGSGWVGQERVNRPDGDTADSDPTVIVDGAGCPWVVWDATPGDTTLWWTRWLGSAWAAQRGVCQNAPGVWASCGPDLAVDGQDRVWLVWQNAHENDNCNIAACYYDGSQWTVEQPVSPPDSDSTDVYFQPKVSCGGGQTWCVWYGGPSTSLPYSVYASRWDSLRGRWGPEMRVSPPDGNEHWWCDVAVDSSGTPHVVWCTHPLYTVFYSHFDGQAWVTPTPVNDTTQVTASPWASPRIVIDRSGMMHLCFTGAKVGASHRDIVYTRNDGSGWLPCQMLTHDSVNDVWYSDVAADRPDNVWVTWDLQGGTEQFSVHVSHWDGVAWSSEQRLDDTTSYYNCGPAVCLDSSGGPWVFWTGVPYTGPVTDDDVFFNRFTNASLEEDRQAPPAHVAILRCATLQDRSCFAASFSLAEAARVRLVLCDGAGRCVAVLADGNMPRGTHTAHCRTPVAPGAYFCRLQTGGRFETSKVILLGQ